MPSREAGQALTELAIASVVLILIIFGAVDLARLYNAQTALQEATRVGARHAALYDSDANINPFLCDRGVAATKTVVGCPPGCSSSCTNGIQNVVDRALLGSLGGSGIGNSTCAAGRGQMDTTAGLPTCLQAGCPKARAGAVAPFGPPFDNTDFPAGTSQPWLYICYNTSADTGSPVSTPPSCASTCGGYDMEVTLVMRYALLIPLPLGPSLQLAGSTHIRVQGS